MLNVNHLRLVRLSPKKAREFAPPAPELHTTLLLQALLLRSRHPPTTTTKREEPHVIIAIPLRAAHCRMLPHAKVVAVAVATASVVTATDVKIIAAATLGLGARQPGTYLVLPCHQSKKLLFPFLETAAVSRYCLHCQRQWHYHNALAFLAVGGQGWLTSVKKLFHLGNCGRELQVLLPLPMPPRILILLCSHKMRHLILWVPRSWASIP
jgi:hypothetical protein